MRKYSKYKNSGCDYLGQIPQHWNANRLADIGVFSSSGIDKKIQEGEPLVRMVNYTDIIKSRVYYPILSYNPEFMIVSCPSSKIEEHSLNKGDMVFIPSSETSEDLGYGSLVDFEDNVVFSYHIIRFQFNKPLYHFFKKYFTNNHPVLNQFSAEGKGTTRQIIGRNVFKNIVVALPPLPEQQSIVAFLDDKTSQIDLLISNSQKKIELLKEKRTALINHAVTKGLDPKSKMKDSGVEWIGEIPVGWDVKPLKYLGSFQNGISKPGDMFGSGFPFLNYGDVYNYEVIPLNPSGLVESSYEEREQYSVRYGDVFFTRTSESKDDIGVCSVCLETIDECVFSGFVIRFRFNKNQQLPVYSKYHFQAYWKKLFIESQMNIVTRASLSQQVLGLVPVLLPTLSEQQEIVKYLDHHTSEIDKEVSLEERRIELLKEYRQSLISEVVTGKINVSDYAV